MMFFWDGRYPNVSYLAADAKDPHPHPLPAGEGVLGRPPYSGRGGGGGIADPSLTRIDTLLRQVQALAPTCMGSYGPLLGDTLTGPLDLVSEKPAGIVKINGETAGVEPQVPSGGMKDSSSGSTEQGEAAIEFSTDMKTVYVERSATRPR